jgi:hypothetical protein
MAWWPVAGIPSAFPPPDARPRGTGWNGRGRRGTAGAADRPFAHVTADERARVGMGRDAWGDGGSVCKTAGITSAAAGGGAVGQFDLHQVAEPPAGLADVTPCAHSQPKQNAPVTERLDFVEDGHRFTLARVSCATGSCRGWCGIVQIR